MYLDFIVSESCCTPRTLNAIKHTVLEDSLDRGVQAPTTSARVPVITRSGDIKIDLRFWVRFHTNIALNFTFGWLFRLMRAGEVVIRLLHRNVEVVVWSRISVPEIY